MRCWVFQLERCPRTGRLHLQSYIEFNTAKRFNAVKNCFWPSTHLGACNKSRAANYRYCTKPETRIGDGDFCFEGGDWSDLNPGRRTDIWEVKESLDAGQSELEVAEAYFDVWVRYERSFRRYRSLRATRRSTKTQLRILWGVAGSGKTRRVYDTHGEGVYDLPRPNGGSVWFDGLGAGHCALLIDDFYGWIPLHLLLKLADRYPLQVPVKGGMVNFNVQYLYITSNKPWQDWYRWEELGQNLQAAFERRIDECTEYTTILQ